MRPLLSHLVHAVDEVGRIDVFQAAFVLLAFARSAGVQTDRLIRDGLRLGLFVFLLGHDVFA